VGAQLQRGGLDHYGAYILAVPFLVTLTDRLDPKLVYLSGVALTVVGHLLFGLFAEGFWSAMAARALTGAGWAGTYMTGLKLLADRVDAKLLSRATAGHAASIGISGALSFACAELVADLAGWKAAFFGASATAALAWVIIFVAVPRTSAAPPLARGALFDFRPVLRNRPAMAYAIVYGIHTLVMSALRGWGAFTTMYTEGMLANTARSPRSAAPAKKDAPMPMPSAAASPSSLETAMAVRATRMKLGPGLMAPTRMAARRGEHDHWFHSVHPRKFGVPSEACSYRATGIRL
jgi:MFS family permease